MATKVWVPPATTAAEEGLRATDAADSRAPAGICVPVVMLKEWSAPIPGATFAKWRL